MAAYYWNGAAPKAHTVRDISSTGLYVVTEERWYPGITAEVPAADVVAQPAQESPQRHGARIAGQQPGEDQHPMAVAARGGRQPGRGQQQGGQVSQPADGLGQQQPGRWSTGRMPVI